MNKNLIDSEGAILYVYEDNRPLVIQQGTMSSTFFLSTTQVDSQIELEIDSEDDERAYSCRCMISIDTLRKFLDNYDEYVKARKSISK